MSEKIFMPFIHEEIVNHLEITQKKDFDCLDYMRNRDYFILREAAISKEWVDCAKINGVLN